MRLFDADGTEITSPREIECRNQLFRERIRQEPASPMSPIGDRDAMCVYGISGDIHDSDNYCWQDSYDGYGGSDYPY